MEEDVKTTFIRVIDEFYKTMNYSVDKTFEVISFQNKVMMEMKNTIKELGERIEELEERIEELEEDEDSTIELCEKVIKTDNDDDFLSAYMELTNALKAEVREDIQNEEELRRC